MLIMAFRGEEIFLLLALPPGMDPGFYWRLGGPQSRSGRRGYKKILCLCRGSNPDVVCESQRIAEVCDNYVMAMLR